MAIDSQGNDLEAVKIPITGFAAIGEKGGAQLAYADLETLTAPPAGYSYLGLFTVDGGPQEGVEAGDNLEFFQLGYVLPSGDDTLTDTLVLAEDNPTVRRLKYGNGGTNGVYVKTAALPVGDFPFLLVTRYRNDTERRRAGIVHISALEPGQETRGEIKSVSVTFSYKFQPDLPNPDTNAAPGGYYYDAYVDLASGNTAVNVHTGD